MGQSLARPCLVERRCEGPPRVIFEPSGHRSSPCALANPAECAEESCCVGAAWRQVHVELKVGLIAPDREPSNSHPSASSELEERIALSSATLPLYEEGNPARSRAFQLRPAIALDAPKRLAPRPAAAIEHLELALGCLAQTRADNQRIAAASAMRNRPKPRDVARLEEHDQHHLGEGWLRLLDGKLDRAGAEPPNRGALAQKRKAALHPAHRRAPLADVPNHPAGEPDDDSEHDHRQNGRQSEPPLPSRRRRGFSLGQRRLASKRRSRDEVWS